MSVTFGLAFCATAGVGPDRRLAIGPQRLVDARQVLLAGQVGRRLRHNQHHDGDEYSGHDPAEHEHRPPAIIGQQPFGRRHAADDRAERVARNIGPDGGLAPPAVGTLGGHRVGRRQHAADADAGDETEGDHRRYRVCDTREEHASSHDHKAGKHGELATVSVRHAAQQHGTEAHADQFCRKDEPELRAGNAPFLGNAGRGEGASTNTSKPSSAFSRTIRTMTIHCLATIGVSSMIVRGSVPAMSFVPSEKFLLIRPLACRFLFVNTAQELDEQCRLAFGESRTDPLLVLVDAAACLEQRAVPHVGQRQRLAAAIALGFAAHEQLARLKPVDDRHRGRAVHLQAAADVGLSNMRVIIDQPKDRDHFLREAELREGFGEMTIGRAVRKSDVEADDFIEPADIALRRTASRPLRTARHDRFRIQHLRCAPNPAFLLRPTLTLPSTLATAN